MKITIRNLQKKIPIYSTRIKKPLLKALKNEGVKRGEITVSFVNDKLISKLNLKYLKKNRPTDVLAFDLTGDQNLGRSGGLNLRYGHPGKILIGDIIISADTALRNSREYGTTPAYELILYAMHGCLHLLGYDDNNLKKRKIMRRKELLSLR